MKTTLTRASEHAEAFLTGLPLRSVATTATVDELRERLTLALPQTGTDPATVIDQLVDQTRGGHLGSAGGASLRG